MQIVEKIDGLLGDDILTVIRKELRVVSSPDEDFRRRLKGPIYSENVGVVRFVLCALEENRRTREEQVDLWKVEGKQYIWTVEHILPQGENIPQPWVDMIAGGDSKVAASLQSQHVHRLGNLTLSGFNSSLGNLSFGEKRDRKDRKGNYVGYRNKLHLNEDLSNWSEWNVEEIDRRTTRLVEETLNLFSLEAV